jgi:hypothetical protein
VCILPQCFLRVQEFSGRGIAFECFDGRGVERCSTAVGRGDYNLDMVYEDFVRVGEFGLVVGRRLTSVEERGGRWCGVMEIWGEGGEN